jgi:hypothetical protein
LPSTIGTVRGGYRGSSTSAEGGFRLAFLRRILAAPERFERHAEHYLRALIGVAAAGDVEHAAAFS